MISIFSSDENISFLKDLLDDLNSQLKDSPDWFFSVYVVDFSPTEDKISDFISEYRKTFDFPLTLVWKKEQGFCQNFNMMSLVGKVSQAKYYICLNDDIRLHPDFVKNILNRAENLRWTGGGIGFIGGTSQKGGWLESVEDTRIPEPVNKVVMLKDLKRLHWEFSACLIPIDVIKKVGEMDHLFSPRLGLVSDNDYLHRMRLHKYATVRDHNATFWHSKAQSQSKLRDPWGSDPHMKRARFYMRLKWGYDMEGDSNGIYDRPFNGNDIFVITNDILHIVGNGVYNLKDCIKIRDCI